MWTKLLKIGVTSKIISILQNLYHSAKTVIRLNEGHSKPIDVTLGLLHGDSLSPLLFALYVSDIEKVLQESGFDGLSLNHRTALHVLLFADDTVVLAPTEGALKKKILVLEQYFDSMELKVNLEKTKVVIFRLEANLHFQFKEQPIDIVSEYVYLGILMSSSAKFRRQMNRAKIKASQVSQTILQLIFRTKLPNFNSQYTLFESVVKPTLLYGGAVWALRYKHELEPVQNNYFRRLLGMHPWLPTAIVRRETASDHLEVSLWEQILTFLYKIKRMEPERYAAIIFQRLAQLDTEGYSTYEMNWVSQVRVGLLPFGLESLLAASPEELAEYDNSSMEIIRTHFKEQDTYDLERLEDFIQYNEVFVYGRQKDPESKTETQFPKKVNRRWNQLPWCLKSNLDLQAKRLITQIRQNSVPLCTSPEG